MSTLEKWAAVPLPWPSAPSQAQFRAGAAAAGIAVPDQGNVADAKQTAVSGVLGALSDYLEKFAPDAPERVKQAACFRLHGYLDQQTGSATRIQADSVELHMQENMSRAFRLSGARALLEPWRARVAIPAWGDD